MAQTVVQNSNSFRIGSAKFEVGDTVGSLVNLGAMKGIKFEESWDEVRQQTDNAGEVLVAVKNHRCKVSGDLFEIDLANLANLRGGFDIYTTQGSSPLDVPGEAITLVGTGLKRMAHKNNDGSEVSNIVVTNTAGDVTYTRNTDYVVTVDVEGNTCIARILGGAIADGQTVHVAYRYTPVLSRTLRTGGKVEIAPKVVRLTNINAAGKKLMITVFKASNSKGISLAFNADDAGEINATSVEMTGTNDVTRAVGEQLFEIYDEQGAA